MRRIWFGRRARGKGLAGSRGASRVAIRTEMEAYLRLAPL